MYIGSMGDVTVQLLDDATGQEIIVDMDYYKRIPINVGDEVTISRFKDSDVCILTGVVSGRVATVLYRNSIFPI